MDEMISRQAVLNLLSSMPPEEAITQAMLIQSVKQMAAAQPERKRGKWIDDGDPFMWECGCCGYRVKRYNNTRYCPNCGADMREDDHETD